MEKAADSIFRATDNRFAPNIEAGIDEHGAVSQLSESLDQLVKTRVGVRINRLEAGRIIYVGDGRDRGPRGLELLS